MVRPIGGWPDSAKPTDLHPIKANDLQRELPQCGPSSGHPGGVNHLMGDGAVKTLSRDIDVATYFFLITRAGHDPVLPIP